MTYLSSHESGSEKHSLKLRKATSLTFLFSLVLFLCPMHSVAQSAPNRDATPVKLVLSETVSSANAKVGQVVSLEVVDTVQANGKIVINAGTHAQAVVTMVRHRGHNRREGRLVLTVKSTTLVDGTEVMLQSAAVQMGSGKGVPVFGPCTFPIPADPAGLFRKGNNVVIPKGTAISATISVSS